MNTNKSKPPLWQRGMDRLAAADPDYIIAGICVVVALVSIILDITGVLVHGN